MGAAYTLQPEPRRGSGGERRTERDVEMTEDEAKNGQG